jgi:hypothetical protein
MFDLMEFPSPRLLLSWRKAMRPVRTAFCRKRTGFEGEQGSDSLEIFLARSRLVRDLLLLVVSADDTAKRVHISFNHGFDRREAIRLQVR